MIKFSSALKSVIVIGVILLLSALVLFYISLNTKIELQTDGKFESINIDLEKYLLYDLGVADINNDELLDLYTVNHSATQSILINQSNGIFTQNANELGLSQDYIYPGMENSDIKPTFDEAGLYIYRFKRNLYLHSHNINKEVTGSITLPWGIEIIERNNSTTEISNIDNADKLDSERLSFTIKKNGSLIINGEGDIVELPHSFSFDGIDPNSIYLGLTKTLANSLKFTIDWRDRHSMAWSDFNGDGKNDVYIGRGGVKGKLNDVSVAVNDELLVNVNGVFSNIIDTTFLEKGNCPGRQSSWVDYNSDGLLDLYTSCGRSTLPGFPNKLYTRIDQSKFSQTISSQNLDFDKISVYKWIDSDQDYDLDLLAVERNNLVYYENKDSAFERTVLRSDLIENYAQFALIDVDLDGDMDAIAVSRTQSILLTYQDATFKATPVTDIGLPPGGRNISVVDYDNDGSLELHLVPGGIYERQENGNFYATGLLSSGLDITTISRAICTWFDIENNGSLDVVCAYEQFYPKPIRWLRKLLDKKASSRFWQIYAFKNNSKIGNWIQIDLEGSTGNKESIGAAVEIIAGTNVQRYIVGQFDTATYSQGHYRIYAGLNDNSRVDQIKTVWPNGLTTIMDDIEVNQLLSIKQ